MEAKVVLRLFERLNDHAAKHLRSDWMQAELEGSCNAEISAAAADRPEKILIFGG